MGKSESSCKSDPYGLHTGTLHSPKLPSMFTLGFRKQNTVISYLFVRSSSQVLCDLMSIVSVYAYASIILLQPVVDSQQFPLVFFHLCLLKE